MTESLTGTITSELKSWKRSLRENEVLDWKIHDYDATVTVCAVVFVNNQSSNINIKKHSFTLDIGELHSMEPALLGGFIDKHVRSSLHWVREKEAGDEVEV